MDTRLLTLFHLLLLSFTVTETNVTNITILMESTGATSSATSAGNSRATTGTVGKTTSGRSRANGPSSQVFLASAMIFGGFFVF